MSTRRKPTMDETLYTWYGIAPPTALAKARERGAKLAVDPVWSEALAKNFFAIKVRRQRYVWPVELEKPMPMFEAASGSPSLGPASLAWAFVRHVEGLVLPLVFGVYPRQTRKDFNEAGPLDAWETTPSFKIVIVRPKPKTWLSGSTTWLNGKTYQPVWLFMVPSNWYDEASREHLITLLRHVLPSRVKAAKCTGSVQHEVWLEVSLPSLEIINENPAALTL